MNPRAWFSAQRQLALLPPAFVCIAFWVSRHILSFSRSSPGTGHGGVLAVTWALLAAFVIINLILAWTERPITVTERQQRQLNHLMVTVNVPVYNEDPDALRLMISSLFAQSRLPNRIQIVDDGSAYDYSAVIDEFKSMAAFFPSVDASWIRTRNGGKRRAQAVTFGSDPLANVFVTLDSDTVLDPAAIEEGIKPFADRRVSSVAGVLLTLNASHNLFTRLTDTWLTAFQMSHPAEAAPLRRESEQAPTTLSRSA